MRTREQQALVLSRLAREEAARRDLQHELRQETHANISADNSPVKQSVPDGMRHSVFVYARRRAVRQQLRFSRERFLPDDSNNNAWRFFGIYHELWSMIENLPVLANAIVLKRRSSLGRAVVAVRKQQHAAPVTLWASPRKRSITPADKTKEARGESLRLLVQPAVWHKRLGAGS